MYEQAVQLIVQEISKFKVGDPRSADIDLGPMISIAAAERAEAWVNEAVAQGAPFVAGRPAAGGHVSSNRSLGCDVRDESLVPGSFLLRSSRLAPMTISRRHSGWPTPLTMACKGACSRRTSTASGVPLKSSRLAGLQVNDASNFRVDHMPYGGVKGSGIGREGTRSAIEEMTELKLLVINLAGGQEG